MLPLLRHAFTKRIFATLIFELFALNCCFILLIMIRRDRWNHLNTYPMLTLGFALTNTLVVQFALWSFGLYSREVVYSGQRLISNLLGALLFSAGLLFPTCYLFSLSGVGVFSFTLKFYAFALIGFTSLIAVERLFVLRLFEDSPYLGNVLVLGTGRSTEILIGAYREQHGTFNGGGVLSEESEDVGKEILGCPVIGTLDDLSGLLSGNRFETVVISTSPYSPKLPVNALLKAKVAGTRVLDGGEFFEKLNRKILLEKLEPVQLLLSENLQMTRFRWFLKDTLEKLAAILLLVLTFPLMVLAAVLIEITSIGPVFYRQWRTGKDGQPFQLIKFRTMVVDAEKDGEPQWARENDSRVTWIGRILRKTRIDELPQIFNVLAGQMAFVGPRPERPEFVELLRDEIPYYDQRHLVKPGLTGWAQVSYHYGANVDDAREKLRYDLYYIKNMSIFFDFMIILATIRTVLFRSYAR